MKVILIEKLSSLGNIGDIVSVRDGYARNFLLPRKIAVPFTNSAYKLFEQSRSQIEEANNKAFAEAEKNKILLDGLKLTIIENAGDDGRLYGSVASKDIATAINNLALDAGNFAKLTRNNVVMTDSIKTIGIHSCKLYLHHEVSCVIEVCVARSVAEAETAFAAAAQSEAA